MTMDESRSMEEATSLPRDIDPYWKEEKEYMLVFFGHGVTMGKTITWSFCKGEITFYGSVFDE